MDLQQTTGDSGHSVEPAAWVVEDRESRALICTYLEGKLPRERVLEIRRAALTAGHSISRMSVSEACARIMVAGAAVPAAVTLQ